MTKFDPPADNLIHLRKNPGVQGIYDVNIVGVDRLTAYDQIELHTVLYPYSRQITSEHLAFYPFEEYVKDVLSHQRSAYAEIHNPVHEIFGLALGCIIALIFARLDPLELLSIESIVSVFGAYVLGKELWDDIERAIVGLTKNRPVTWQDNYYRYRLEKQSTLTAYSYLAKRRRYQKVPLLPAKIDFIKQSNSQTLRMCFDGRDLFGQAEPAAHIHSIHIDPEREEAFQAKGFMFGIKLSLNKTTLGITRHLELFQSLDRENRGCLDIQGRWVENAVFYRKTVTIGRIKIYLRRGLIHGLTVIAP